LLGALLCIVAAAVDGVARDDAKAFAVVVAASSSDGVRLARRVAQLCTHHSKVGHTVSAADVLERVAKGSSSAEHRVALSENVAGVVLREPAATVILDETVFAKIPGALTSFHTCWDSRGKIEGPNNGIVSCTRATFVVVVDMGAHSHGHASSPVGGCDSYDECLGETKASTEHSPCSPLVPILPPALRGALSSTLCADECASAGGVLSNACAMRLLRVNLQAWLAERVLPMDRAAGPAEVEAILRRLSDIVVFR